MTEITKQGFERMAAMNATMNLALVAAVAASATLQAAVRVETRTAPLIATGVEMLGTADGGTPVAWNTMREPDGWTTLTSGGQGTGRPTADVLVLNGPLVVGGRLSASVAWDASRIIVVRDDVVVPSGKTITLGAGCIVKFTEGARIAVESGGLIVANGAYLAAFDDDSVGDDTDMNGAATGRPPYRGWLDDAAVAALATVKFMDGATNLPTRTYTTGKTYGALPSLAKNDAIFGGWFTAEDGKGTKATESGRVASGETVLHAYWIPRDLSIESNAGVIDCTEVSGAFAISANVGWTVQSDKNWVQISASDSGVSYSVAVNDSAEDRTATIRVVSEAGEIRDFTLTQKGMPQLAAPIISPADGTTFPGSARSVSLGGAESGAEIRYTRDGSEPTAASKLYTKSFNVFDTTVVKARAFMQGKLASDTATARFVRIPSLAEALDAPLWTVTTGGDAAWTVEESSGRNGASCARSGSIGDEQESTFSTTVEGAGTLTFWWRVDCEDDPEYDNWDYLLFKADGAEVARIDGDTGWHQVSVRLNSDRTHTLSWSYVKDYMDDEDSAGIEDCGWVDQISWTPLAGDSGVPVAWLENLGMVADGATAIAAANADPDGDGLTTAQEYVAGTDPNDPGSKLTAFIDMVDGNPVVTYAPDLLDERVYKKLGKKRLDDTNEPWVEVKAGEERSYNFFKVVVEMP